jgi:hypothetical protein
MWAKERTYALRGGDESRWPNNHHQHHHHPLTQHHGNQKLKITSFELARAIH